MQASENTITVKAGGDLQAALDRAKPGDTIQLESGTTYRGNFKLPKKPGSEFITVRTNAANNQLPAAETRLDPVTHGAVLAKLSPLIEAPVVITDEGAHHYRFIGIEFTGTKNGSGNIIQIGTTEEKRIEDLPHHIEFDRVYVHAVSDLGQRRGIAANGRFIKIANSHISGIRRRGEESQAIAVRATDGPVEIVNNYLEAAAENILFGGAESFLQLTLMDSVVKGNHLNKPLKWREEGWVVKNILEIKHGRRIKVTDNLMTNNWAGGQSGTAVLFTTREDSGKKVVIEDIEFSNNTVRNSPHALNVYGAEGAGGHRLTIRNNLFEAIGDKAVEGSGRFLVSTAWDGLTIENNTIINSGNITTAYGDPVKNFVFRNNIVFENEYGFMGDSASPGKSTVATYFPNGDITHNAIIGGSETRYNGKNIFPINIAQVGFADAEAGDFSLRPDSPLRKKGYGGGPIGASKIFVK